MLLVNDSLSNGLGIVRNVKRVPIVTDMTCRNLRNFVEPLKDFGYNVTIVQGGMVVYTVW